MATAIVTESTNKHSWIVELKHSGRASGSQVVIGCAFSVDWPPSSGSCDMAQMSGKTKNLEDATQGRNARSGEGKDRVR